MLQRAFREKKLLNPLSHQLQRSISVVPDDENKVLRAFRAGAVLPRVVPFQLSLGEARRVFEAWHRQQWLAPSRLLQRGVSSMHAALLPFWLFEATVQVEFTGLLGFPLDHRSLVWRDTHWRSRGFREYPWTLSAMQVYASYKYRRDLAEAAKVPGMLGRSRALTLAEAEPQVAEDVGWAGEEAVALDPPAMRQAVAWQLALRNIHRAEAAEAERVLRRETGCEAVRDIKVRVRALRRRARLLWLPAYVAAYSYGQAFNAASERRPQRFQAVVSGLDAASLAAERHFSPSKVQAAAAAALAAGWAALGVAGVAGLGTADALSVPAAFWAFMAVGTAGLAARMGPALAREGAEGARLAAEEADFERYVALGLGPAVPADDDQEAIRCNLEWRRWEEADKWAWDEARRATWAERLWRAQAVRRLERRRARAAAAAAAARAQLEGEAEARRRRRWGHAKHHAAWGGRGAAGFDAAGRGPSNAPGGDALGYYAALGLDAGAPGLGEADIKAAWHAAALRWHPDRQTVSDEEGRRRAHERFSRLKAAYETLRDPERRREYDSGQTVTM